MSYDLQLEYVLPAPPAQIMELLTDSVLLRKWSGGDGFVSKEVGGEFEMFDGWVFGKVVAIAPDALTYTWKTTDWTAEAPPSTVTYQLLGHEAGTLLKLSHTGLPDQQEMEDHQAGWTDYFFQPMEDYIMAFDRD